MSTTYENACFSNAAYGEQNCPMPAGWQEITNIDPALLANSDNGFQAKVFKSDSGEIVIAYAGTNVREIGDLGADWEIYRERLPKNNTMMQRRCLTQLKRAIQMRTSH